MQLYTAALAHPKSIKAMNERINVSSLAQLALLLTRPKHVLHFNPCQNLCVAAVCKCTLWTCHDCNDMATCEKEMVKLQEFICLTMLCNLDT